MQRLIDEEGLLHEGLLGAVEREILLERREQLAVGVLDVASCRRRKCHLELEVVRYDRVSRGVILLALREHDPLQASAVGADARLAGDEDVGRRVLLDAALHHARCDDSAGGLGILALHHPIERVRQDGLMPEGIGEAPFHLVRQPGEGAFGHDERVRRAVRGGEFHDVFEHL